MYVKASHSVMSYFQMSDVLKWPIRYPIPDSDFCTDVVRQTTGT